MVSYSWADKDIAREVANYLEKLGFNIWIDTSNMQGNIYGSMTAAILSSQVVIPFISDGYVQSRNCALEIDFASDQRKPLLPVRLSHSQLRVTKWVSDHDLSNPVWNDQHKKVAALSALAKALTSALQGNMANTSVTAQSAPPIAVPTAARTAKSGTCFPHMPMRIDPPHWIDRSDLWDLIDQHLKASRVAILHGVGGSGKTFTAMKYAHRVMSRVNVSWIGSKTEEELQKSLEFFAFHIFNLTFLAAVKDIGSVAVLITTRIPLVLRNHIHAMESIPVNFPSVDSCRAYFQDIPGRNLTEMEADEIFHLCNGLPLRLSVAAAYLGQRRNISVKAFIGLVEKEKQKLNRDQDIYPEVSVSLDTLEEKSEKAFELIHWLALLDPDHTILEYAVYAMKRTQKNLKFLFGRKRPDGSNIEAVLGPMADLRLITTNNSVLSMHRCIHSVVLEKSTVPKSQGQYFADVYKRMLNSLHSVKRAIALGDLEGLSKMMKSITELELSWCTNTDDSNLGSNEVKLLFEVVRSSTSLQFISLQSNNAGADGAKAVADSLMTNNSLKAIDLGDNNIDTEGAMAIAQALATNSNVESFHIWGNKIGAEGAKAFAHTLSTNRALKSIDLRGSNIGPEGARAVGYALATNRTLQSINLSVDKIGAEGAKAVAHALTTNRALQSISLRGNLIGPDGAKAIADALTTNKTLLSINLRGTEGATAIAAALTINKTLRHIDLGGNYVGEEGRTAIAEASKARDTLKVEI
ncbi:hypothetical protein DFJ73DRAFT_962876 [Zopfochytrium polystomum]|nr:hypothetical protein DFJ73DRAFT_962876 [Zopfochytrium polystomum]